MKVFVALLGLFSFSTLVAQYNIRWSELLPVKGKINTLLPVSYSDFYTLRYSGSGISNSTYLYKHSNFEVNSKGKVSAKLEKSIGSVEKILIINDIPVIFITDKKDGENNLYYQKYSNLCEPIGKPVKLAHYKMPKSWKRKGEFAVLISDNKDFFCLEYEVPGSKEEHDRFGYKVFDSNFEAVSEGEYELPYESQNVSISNNYLSNTGDYFIAAKVYKQEEDSKKIFRQSRQIDKIVLMHVDPEGLEEFELKLKDEKQISDMTFSSDNQRIMSFTGLYGETESRGGQGIKGVFFIQLDFNTKTIISEGWNEFGLDFITQDWSDKAIEKAKKGIEEGKSSPEFYSYDVRNMITLPDGSIIGMLEQYFVQMVSARGGGGPYPNAGYSYSYSQANYTYYYYYNDVIVYKISKEGKFDWVKKIQKYQVSVNDEGFYSSIASFVSHDKLCILFNDNQRNYDELGEFIDDGDNFYPAGYRKNTNTVALVEFDIQSGEFTRKTLFDREETKAYAVPKKFLVDYNQHEMLMVLLYGRKEKYGILSFE